VKIQHLWVRIKRVRMAYISLFFPYWMEIQERVQREVNAEIAARELDHAKAVASIGNEITSPRRPAPLKKSSSLSARGAAATPPSRSTLSHVMGMRKMKRRSTCNLGQRCYDALPVYMVRHMLSAYIRQMQYSYSDRMNAWEQAMAKDELNRDVDDYCAAAGGPRRPGGRGPPAPRRVYIDGAELEALVRQRVDEFGRGVWKGVLANFLRLMNKAFYTWLSAHADFQRARRNIATGRKANAEDVFLTSGALTEMAAPGNGGPETEAELGGA